MDLRAMAMGLGFALMWSSAFATARVIVAAAPPLHALALRFVISGILALLLARLFGQSLRLTRAQWRATALFGLCQNGLYLGLNFIAMQTIEASLAAIIASTMPLLVALLGWLFLGARLRPLGILGLVLGFSGVAVIMGARISGGVDMAGLGLCAIAAFALAGATLSVRGASSGGNLLTVVGWQMLVGAGLLSVAALGFETLEVQWSWQLGAAFAYQVIAPGLMATGLWFALVQRIGAVRGAAFHFLNPFFGVAIAAMLLGEHINGLDYLGVAIVMGGILAVQLARAEQS